MELSVLVFEVGIILALILFNGLLAMSELAVVSSKKVSLQQMVKDGHRGAKVALDLANNPSNFLAAIQIGITLVGVVAGAFGGATIATQLEEVLKPLPYVGYYHESLAFGVVVLGVTVMSIIFGELVPKRFALNDPEKIASFMAPMIFLLTRIAAPFVKLLGWVTEAVIRLLGIQQRIKPSITEDELKLMIEEGREAGIFDREEEGLLKRVLRFSDRRISELMTQRLKIVSLDIRESFDHNLKIILNAPHSYFPVFEEDQDHILGVISVKCLMGKLALQKKIDIRDCLIEPLYVAESMATTRVLEIFKSTGRHLALVVDEYGSVAGIITLIDLLEAIVGDIPPSTKPNQRDVVVREDGSLLVEGLISIDELEDIEEFKFHTDQDREDYDTLGGFVMAKLGRIPKEGDHFKWKGHRFEVVDMDAHRVDKVLIMRKKPRKILDILPSPQKKN